MVCVYTVLLSESLDRDFDARSCRPMSSTYVASRLNTFEFPISVSSCMKLKLYPVGFVESVYM